jgi:hypothetical protein
MVGPALRSIRLQTEARIREINRYMGGTRLSEENINSVCTTSRSDIKTFERFKEKILDTNNARKLFVLVHDECHWGFKRGSMRELVLNGSICTSSAGNSLRQTLKKIQVSEMLFDDSKDYQSASNYIQLLVSATPYVCQTRYSQIPTENEIRVNVLDLDNLTQVEYVTLRRSDSDEIIMTPKGKLRTVDMYSDDVKGDESALRQAINDNDISPYRFRFEPVAAEERLWRICCGPGNRLATVRHSNAASLSALSIRFLLCEKSHGWCSILSFAFYDGYCF